MIVSYGTLKNTRQKDKPNEDLVFYDLYRKIFILLDGVSRDNINGKYPYPSPAVDIVEIIKSSIFFELSKRLQKDNNNVVNAILKANGKVKEYNKTHNLRFPAGAVGIVGVIDKDIFYYSYIGDCYGRTIVGNKIDIFTKSQTHMLSKHKEEFSTYEIRYNICNNINHPYGYGVLNGDRRAEDFIRSGVIDCRKVEQIILSSDGMESYLSKISVVHLREKKAQILLREAELYCNLMQDDRTVLKIEKD